MVGTGNFGVGRLTSTTDGAGSTSFVYDARGNIISETRVTGTQSYTVAYEYDLGDKATKITYPSGRIVELSYDAAGRVSGIDMREDAISSLASVLSNITYFPMSDAGSLWSLKSATYGNGLALAIGHDADGRLKDIDLAPAVGAALEDLTYGYDAAGNITSITDNLTASRTETYQYDGLSRLSQAVGAYGTIDYTYDLVGNRLSRMWDIGGTAYGEVLAYGAGTHQLATVTGGGGTSVRTMTYAASGQLATDEKNGATYVYDYDDAGRMVEALNGTASLASYAYDAFEQRIEKDDGTDAVHYVYDLAGRLIAEQDGATGAALREYIYLGLMPAAYVDHSGANPATYYVHTDQVMRPRKLTDAAGTVLWDRIATPFGDEHTVTGTLTQKLQFPGQIEETETDFYQNWRRDYDPALGRYVQSDPIGLLGGINTYGYVGGNPVSYVDPTGECPWCVGALIGVGLELLTNKCATFQDLLFAGALGATGGAISKAVFLRHGPKALTRKIGKEWSHSIPKRVVDKLPKGRVKRLLNRRGGLNGSWASPKRHFRHDKNRFPKGWTNFGDRLSKPLQKLDRIPDWLKGTTAGGAIGAGIAGNRSCGCEKETQAE